MSQTNKSLPSFRTSGKANKPITIGRITKWLLVLNFLASAGWATYNTAITGGAAVPSPADWTVHISPWLATFGITFAIGCGGILALGLVVMAVMVLYFAFFAKEEAKKPEAPPAAPKKHPYRRK